MSSAAILPGRPTSDLIYDGRRFYVKYSVIPDYEYSPDSRDNSLSVSLAVSGFPETSLRVGASGSSGSGVGLRGSP